MVLIPWLTLAFAAEPPTCSVDPLADPPEVLSVAWVSRLRRRARRGTWLSVVSTQELQRIGSTQTLGEVLRTLGIRRRLREPTGRYKVVVFDIGRGALCRPIVDADFGEVIGGVSVCDAGRPHPRRGTAGCGLTEDRATGDDGLPLYRAQWSTLSANGFCVLPADRFFR